MSEIKEIYAIDWMGPYDSLEEIKEREGSDWCCMYLITGRPPRGRSFSIMYVGITSRYVDERLADPDHIKKQEGIRDKQYWAGRFSVASYNILTGAKRNRAELVEHLLAYYLSNLPKSKLINEKKTSTLPKKPVAIISRWQKKRTDDERYNKPSILHQLPDTLMYIDEQFYASDKLRHINLNHNG